MKRSSLLAGKRALQLVGIALIALAAPRVAMAQDAAPDLLKFSTNGPVFIVNYVKADKMTDFEEGWSAIRALLAKSDNAELKAFGETLAKLYRVDQPPFDLQGGKAVIYIFQIDAASTTFSYNPRTILYDYLKAGQTGSSVTRAEADAPYNKLMPVYMQIMPWSLIKAK